VPFFKSLDCRYKRIRKRPGGAPNKDLYDYKVAGLRELEQLSVQGIIDLLYGDESGVCTEWYVPYGWQFADEQVSVPATKQGKRLNCFALVSRTNQCHWSCTTQKIDGTFMVEQFEALSLKITRHTVVIVDGASPHRSKLIKQRLPFWRKRGLWLF
jgi:hypothetical protein